MKLSIITFLACLASPAVGRLSRVGMHNEATDEILPVRNLESSNKQTDASLRLEEFAAIDGVAKRISAHRMPGRDLKKANDQGVEEIRVGKILADKANLLANHEGARHLESEGYQDKLETIVTEADRFTSQDRNLQAADKLQPVPSNEFREIGSQVHELVHEKGNRDLQVVTPPDVDSETCILDTDALLKAYPDLDQAMDAYIASAEFTQYFDPTNNLTYAEITYSPVAENSLRTECALAGGYFDENTGLIACGFAASISLSERYVSCLASTPECVAKDNFEFLEMALENAGWTCIVAVPSQSPTGAPGVVPGSEDSSVTSPSLAANYDACMLETNLMGINYPDLYVANVAYIESLDGYTDPVTGYVNFGSSAEAKAELQAKCADAGGYFDVNQGTLTCDLSSDFSTTITATVTGHVNCLADIPDCTNKNHYAHLQLSLENEGFFNCRVSGVSPASSPGSSSSTVSTPAPTPAPFIWTINPFRPAVPAPGPSVTPAPTAVPTPASTNAATLAPVFPSTGKCTDDYNVLYFLYEEVFDAEIAFIESLDYSVEPGEIYYFYDSNEAKALKIVCNDAGATFVQSNDILVCSIDYEGVEIYTETAGYASCLAPTEACEDFEILDMLANTLEEVGYYDCYID